MLDFIRRFQFFIYPLIVHISVVFQMPYVVVGLLPVFYMIMGRPFYGNQRRVIFKSLLLFVLLVMAIVSWQYRNHSIIYLPPILMILAVLYPFIRSLMPGNTPLITRFYQLTESNVRPEVILYTQKVTWLWTGFITILLFHTLYLTFFASLQTWSLFTNFINYVLILVLMIAEWSFRVLWFRRWESPIRFARQLLTVDQRAWFEGEK